MSRYNTFFVLYPLGIASEMWLVNLAGRAAGVKYGTPTGLAIRSLLLLYVPGTFPSLSLHVPLYMVVFALTEPSRR